MEQVNKKFFISEGIKFTKQRNTVLDILNDSDKPMYAEDIYFEYLKHDESISLSTIYRILDVFFSKGIITKTVFQDDTKACFMIKHEKHKHYLICVECKKLVELEDCPFHDLEKQLESQTDFVITSHRLEMFGVCPDCKEQIIK